MNDNDNTLTLFKDPSIQIGLVLLLTSFLAFSFTTDGYTVNSDLFTGMFFITYGLTIIYWLITMNFNKTETSSSWKFNNFTRNVILLQLFNISAYTLNRSMAVFNISPNWVVGFLLLSNSLLLIYVLVKDYIPTWFNHIIVAVANFGFLFHLYESFYLIPFYPITIVGFWFFGIALHALVPILYACTYWKVIRQFLQQSPKYWTTTLLTWVATIFFVGYFSIQFYNINQAVKDNFHQSNLPFQEQNLPSWVATSQSLKKNFITERALKSDIVYATYSDLNMGFGSRMSRINEIKKHDPLVVIASFFNQDIKISNNDRIDILKSLYNARHQTERKLWSGHNLSTSDIVTNVQLFPAYRLAYTEKTFKIHNSLVSGWGRQQEALYTFYLPEGSVVTSASLWIEGKEEPAYMTTKSKADSAYTTIVGRERRDPMLIHWQEGNRVTVRVFPCTPTEDRQFKIGITTPLQKLDNTLKYENIDFEGPYYKTATESINIISQGSLQNMDAPFSFNENGTNYNYKGTYNSQWSLAFDEVPLSTSPFTFNGKSYQLSPYQKETTTFTPENIYLDINAGWTRSELKQIWNQVKNKNVFVYSNYKMEQVNADNKRALFKQLRKQNFTLFPFDKLGNSGEHLVISKYNQLTPTLADLDKSSFVQSMSTFFQKNQQPVRVFNLGETISPYLKSLGEFRAIQLNTGTTSELLSLLDEGTFFQNVEDEKTIVNQYANFQIKEIPATRATSKAPDHLMRLFAYNDILKQVGKNYFNKKALANELIASAKESYVVTPISSLIVLESIYDYDRFDIKKSENSLQNASFGNSGAVPEPAEWILIIMVLILTLFFYWRK